MLSFCFSALPPLYKRFHSSALPRPPQTKMRCFLLLAVLLVLPFIAYGDESDNVSALHRRYLTRPSDPGHARDGKPVRPFR